MGMLTYGTICSGIEAPSLAWESLGFKPLWFSEIEPFPSAVLKHHYPDVPNVGDFTAPDSWQYMLDNPPDVLFGGTPCQAFSVAGQRQSLDDDRGNLSLMFTKLWKELKERGTTYAIWENVPGVLNTPDNAFGCFLAGMVGEEHPLSTAGGKWADAGCTTSPYGQVAWRTLDAQFYGVPQRRRRVFAVVSGVGNFSPSEILFKPDSLQGDTEKGKETGQEVAEGTGIVFDPRSQDGEPRIYGDAREVVAPSLNTASGGQRQTCVASYWNGEKVCNTLTSRNASGSQRMPDKDNFQCVIEPIPIHNKAFTQNTRDEVRYIGGDGQTAGALGSNEGMNQRTYISSPMVVRRLIPVECERLMGMRDNYTRIPWRGKPKEDCPDGPRFKAIGNSIAVPCLRWIGERICQQR